MDRRNYLLTLPGVINVSRARSTSTLVMVVDGEAFGVDTDDGQYPFSTICDPHGGIVFHQNKSLAHSWASAPQYWCPTCEISHHERNNNELP